MCVVSGVSEAVWPVFIMCTTGLLCSRLSSNSVRLWHRLINFHNPWCHICFLPAFPVWRLFTSGYYQCQFEDRSPVDIISVSLKTVHQWILSVSVWRLFTSGYYQCQFEDCTPVDIISVSCTTVWGGAEQSLIFNHIHRESLDWISQPPFGSQLSLCSSCLCLYWKWLFAHCS